MPGDARSRSVDPGRDRQALEEAVTCPSPGEWEENLVIGKDPALRAAELKPEPDVLVKSAKEGWPVILIESDQEIEVTIEGFKITGAFGDCHGEGPERVCPNGISVRGRVTAVIQNNTIGDNADGIETGDSSQATIQGDRILNNGYGVALYHQPCSSYGREFEGAVRGSSNEISGNEKADICPSQLDFLATEEGGCCGPPM